MESMHSTFLNTLSGFIVQKIVDRMQNTVQELKAPSYEFNSSPVVQQSCCCCCCRAAVMCLGQI